jgi:hypothetical protein
MSKSQVKVMTKTMLWSLDLVRKSVLLLDYLFYSVILSFLKRDSERTVTVPRMIPTIRSKELLRYDS